MLKKVLIALLFTLHQLILLPFMAIAMWGLYGSDSESSWFYSDASGALVLFFTILLADLCYIILHKKFKKHYTLDVMVVANGIFANAYFLLSY